MSWGNKIIIQIKKVELAESSAKNVRYTQSVPKSVRKMNTSSALNLHHGLFASL